MNVLPIRELGARWQPAPLLKYLAEQGKTFREFDAERDGNSSFVFLNHDADAR